MTSLQRLQALIQKRDREAGRELNLEGLLPQKVSDDTYGTLLMALKLGIISANDLLVEGVEETIERGGEFFQIIGLALRGGANPNMYVTVRQSDGNVGIVHILYYAWLITPKTLTEMEREIPDLGAFEAADELEATQNLMLDVLAILVTAGSDASMPVVNIEQLIERRREILREPISQAEVLIEVNKPLSIRTLILDDPAERGFVESAIEVLDFFDKNRRNVGDFAQYTKDDEGRIQNNISLEIVQLLDQPTHLGIDPEIFTSCVNVHANRCVKKLLASEQVTFADAEDGFLEAVDSYNLGAAIQIIRAGFKPRYNHVDRIILRARDKHNDDLPISEAMMNRVLIELVERGVGIDDQQLFLLYQTSQATHDKIKDLLKVPYWKRTCTIPGNYIRPDLRSLARELNLAPDASKADICHELKALDSANPKELLNVKQRLQHQKLESQVTSLGDLQHRNALAATHSGEQGGICKNANLLSREETDYADIDLVIIEERHNSYCFETPDFAALLDSGINPLTGNKIPEVKLEEIRGKLNALRTYELSEETVGLKAALAKIKEVDTDEYENFIKQRTADFVKLVGEAGISQDYFTASIAEGGLTSEEMQFIARGVSGQKSRFNLESREHSRRALAATIMELIDEAKTLEVQEEKLALIESIFNAFEEKLRDVVGDRS